MPISPLSPVQSQPLQPTSRTDAAPIKSADETTFPKLDGGSKDTSYAAPKPKALVDLSGGANAKPASTFVDGGITASDDWEAPGI